MVHPVRDPRRLMGIAVLLLILVPVLGVLQYRWIGEISRAERERSHAGIAMASSRAIGDFESEIGRARGWFQPFGGPPPDPVDHIVRRFREWQQGAAHPGLIENVWLARRSPEGAASLQRFVATTETLEPAVWPADLEEVRQRLEQGGPFRGSMRPQAGGDSDLTAVIPAGIPSGDHAPGRSSPSFILVRLSGTVLRNQVLADAIGRHFPQGGDLIIMVQDRETPGKLVYQSDPSFSAAGARPELSLPFFGDASGNPAGLAPPPPAFAPPREPSGAPRREPPPRQFGGPRGAPPERRDQPPDARRGGPPEPESPVGRPRQEARWELLVFHRGGPLDEAVARVRHRNLAAAGGVLVILTAAIALLLHSTRRSHLLATQQMEFIAGFTHELHTPLAAIRSAGQNLTDGVVKDPEQLRRYGSMIEREGRRLSEMVDTILEFARMQAIRARRPVDSVAISDVVERALSATRSLLEERGINVETRIPSDLPPVSGDASALTRAIQNLIENAAKYGGSAGWIGIRATSSGSEVVVAVEDRGPGIGREELPHLFQPFYRGRRGISMGIPGSGLGLSIVDRIARGHGGRLTAANNAGGGARFSLHLPVAAEETRG